MFDVPDQEIWEKHVLTLLDTFYLLHGSCVSTGTFPIDLTKTRLQVQGQSQYTEVRYRGMFHALFRIGKEEGIRALYSGYGTTFT